MYSKVGAVYDERRGKFSTIRTPRKTIQTLKKLIVWFFKKRTFYFCEIDVQNFESHVSAFKSILHPFCCSNMQLFSYKKIFVSFQYHFNSISNYFALVKLFPTKGFSPLRADLRQFLV